VLPTGFFAFAILRPNLLIECNHRQKGTYRQRLARVPQTAQQNSKELELRVPQDCRGCFSTEIFERYQSRAIAEERAVERPVAETSY
jgi:transposase-like protein